MLSGWYVISLRPSGAHAPVRRAAVQRGASVLALSTLALARMDAGAALGAALESPLVVFTSPAAVAHAKAQRPLLQRPGQICLAVGSGTATALARAGAADARAPSGRADSEALLAMPDLQSLAGVDVGVVTAPGGRGLIAAGLAQRGARVHLAEVYRRIPIPMGAAQLARLAALPATSALLVSSGEAFAHLWDALAEDRRAALRSRPAVASSPRLVAMLAAQGFTTLVLAAGAVPSQMLSALAADVSAGRFR